MAEGVFVKKSDVTVSGDVATVRNAALARALKSDPAAALALLRSQNAGLQLRDITVRDDGAVDIANAAVSRNLAAFAARPRLGAAADNGVCGFKCGGIVREFLDRFRILDRFRGITGPQ